MSQQQFSQQPQSLKRMQPQRLAQPYGYPTDQPATNLMDLIDRILDKGLVVDLYVKIKYVKINLLGIELLEVQARLVVAGIETYLRYAKQMQLMGLVATPYRRDGRGMMSEGQGEQQQQPHQQQQQRGTRIPVNAPNMRRQAQRPQSMQRYIQR